MPDFVKVCYVRHYFHSAGVPVVWEGDGHELLPRDFQPLIPEKEELFSRILNDNAAWHGMGP